MTTRSRRPSEPARPSGTSRASKAARPATASRRARAQARPEPTTEATATKAKRQPRQHVEEKARAGLKKHLAEGKQRAERATEEPGPKVVAGKGPTPPGNAGAMTEDEKFLQSPPPPPEAFLHSDSWRALRILSEFVEGFDTLACVKRGVSVFGSARTKPSDPHYQAAIETGRRLAHAGFEVITGGGPGIMEAANRGAREGGGHSIGCNIELPFEQVPNPYLDTLVNFRYFFVRKTMFVKYSSAFIIFPGGFGTLDELFESLTLIQTGKIHRFPVVLFGRAFWSGLLDWLGGPVLAGSKIAPADLELLLVTDDPAEAVSFIMREHGPGTQVKRAGAATKGASVGEERVSATAAKRAPVAARRASRR